MRIFIILKGIRKGDRRQKAEGKKREGENIHRKKH